MRSLIVIAIIALYHAAAAGTLVPNSRPYADRNPAAVTGRAGNATVSARALLGRDGRTEITVEAGRLDGAPPGSITKLQLKAFDSAEQVAWTKNYTGLSGPTQQQVLTGLRRGQPLQIQTSVRASDSARTEVVTTSNNVRLRPDPTVQLLALPGRARLDAPVGISANIAELNHDAGARATCVLRVDGVTVDRAENIWVDAGDVVACDFTYAFPTLGTAHVEVALIDVAPGDYDTTNNARAATIIIDEPTGFEWTAVASRTRSSMSVTSRGWYELSDHSQQADWEFTQDATFDSELSYLYGDKPTRMVFPISIHMTGVADGDVVHQLDLVDRAADNVYDDGEYSYAAFTYDDDAGYGVTVLTESVFGMARTYVDIRRATSHVVYLSQGYLHWWNAYDGDTYFYLPPIEESGRGELWPMTSTYEGSWTVSDANGQTMTASAALALTPVSGSFHEPYACQSYEAPYVGYACMSQDSEYSGVEAVLEGFTP
jgi:hypothetical protein